MFLFLRDAQFFEQTIRPFLLNKIEKTFIDYYLLQHEERMLYFARTENLPRLNVAEQVLLIDYLSRSAEHLEDARAIA